MDCRKIFELGLREASMGYAEQISREWNLPVIQAPAVDFAVRKLVFDLLNNNIVDLEKLYDFLDKNRYRENTPEDWWRK